MEEKPVVAIEIIHQGCVKVNGGYIQEDSSNIACLYVDLGTKYAEIDATATYDERVDIFLSATELSMHLLEGKDEYDRTVVSFPEYKGWKLFAADIHRYTLAVCLIKE